MRTILLLGAAAVLAAGQTPAPQPLPAGFRVVHEMKLGSGFQIQAQKPNTNFPEYAVDPEIRLGYSWMLMPGADKTVEMVAQQPEEPATQTGLIRDEPNGKQRYKGGVLWWRKTTTPWVGTNGPDVVTYSGHWMGFVSGGLLGVGVANFYGTKDVAQAWIDDLIDKTKPK